MNKSTPQEGFVKVMRGKHEGRGGLFDDLKSDHTAIVYWSYPIAADYDLVPLRDLVNVTSGEAMQLGFRVRGAK